jgi:hypothetical protein
MLQFEILKNWLEKEGCEVKISTMTNFVSAKMTSTGKDTINIHHNYNKEKNGLYSLIHEAGHFLQKSDELYIQYMVKNQLNSIDDDVKASMLVFMNEIDAWNRGEKLASDLGLNIDYKSLNKNKNEALLTYYTK